jgi:predicted RNase H-like HicB family nuclease
MMNTLRYTYWQDEEMWLGYLEEFPDYWTQGETRQELEENLKELFQEFSGGMIPHIRRVAELQVA